MSESSESSETPESSLSGSTDSGGKTEMDAYREYQSNVLALDCGRCDKKKKKNKMGTRALPPAQATAEKKVIKSLPPLVAESALGAPFDFALPETRPIDARHHAHHHKHSHKHRSKSPRRRSPSPPRGFSPWAATTKTPTGTSASTTTTPKQLPFSFDNIILPETVPIRNVAPLGAKSPLSESSAKLGKMKRKGRRASSSSSSGDGMPSAGMGALSLDSHKHHHRLPPRNEDGTFRERRRRSRSRSRTPPRNEDGTFRPRKHRSRSRSRSRTPPRNADGTFRPRKHRSRSPERARRADGTFRAAPFVLGCDYDEYDMEEDDYDGDSWELDARKKYPLETRRSDDPDAARRRRKERAHRRTREEEDAALLLLAGEKKPLTSTPAPTPTKSALTAQEVAKQLDTGPKQWAKMSVKDYEARLLQAKNAGGGGLKSNAATTTTTSNGAGKGLVTEKKGVPTQSQMKQLHAQLGKKLEAAESVARGGATPRAPVLSANQQRLEALRAKIMAGAEANRARTAKPMPTLVPSSASSATGGDSTTTTTTAKPGECVQSRLMRETMVQQMAMRLQQMDKTAHPGLKSLMVGGQFTNLAGHGKRSSSEAAANDGDDAIAAIFKHLEHSHQAYYGLLRDNGLLAEYRATADLVLIVPDPGTMEAVTNRVSEETRAIMLYHALVVPVAQPIKSVQTMSEYKTLSPGQSVQVERRDECFYINGHHMHSDIFHRTRVYHIHGMIAVEETVVATVAPADESADGGSAAGSSEEAGGSVEEMPQELPPPQSMPPELPPPMNQSESDSGSAAETSDAEKENVMPGGSGSQEESGSAEEPSTTTTTTTAPEGASESDETQPEPVTQPAAAEENIASFRVRVIASRPCALRQVAPVQEFRTPLLKTVTSKMQQSYYSAALDLAGHIDASHRPLSPLTVSMRTYDPAPLFGQYQAGRMREISRLCADPDPATFSFAPEQQTKLDVGNKRSLLEFSFALKSAPNVAGGSAAAMPQIARADLMGALTEFSFPCPTAPGKQCVVLCRLQAAGGSGGTSDGNTYMSEDESVLVRFKANKLDTICVSQQLLAHPSPATSGGNHFLELFLDEAAKSALYRRKLSADEFSAFLLTNASTREWVKKKAKQSRKKAGKVGRKVVSRAEREAKRLKSMRVRQVPISALGLADLADQEGEAGEAATLTAKVYDKNVNLLDSVSAGSLSAQRYQYQVGEDKFSGYVIESNNLIGASMGRSRAGQYLDVRTPLQTVSFNFSATTLNAKQAYWGAVGNSVYVIYFSPANKFERLLVLPKSSRLAKTVMIK